MEKQVGNGSPSLGPDLGTRISAVAARLGSRGKAAKVAEISDDALYTYISGRAKPSFPPLAKLCAATGVSLDWLATGDGPMLLTDRADYRSPEPDQKPSRLLSEEELELLVTCLVVVERAAARSVERGEPPAQPEFKGRMLAELFKQQQARMAGMGLPRERDEGPRETTSPIAPLRRN